MRAERSLRSSRDFERVLRTGTRASSGGVSVRVAPRRGDGPSRLGLVVRAPTAVRRNRTKRRLRAAFAAGGPASGYDVVVQSGDLEALPFAELGEDLARALERARGMRT